MAEKRTLPMTGWLDHGVTGNGRILALVSPTASVDWLCLPRFDSPSVFARLLDNERGGTFRFLSGSRELKGKLSYLPNTNVLVNRFSHKGAAWEVVDFAPRLPDGWQTRCPAVLLRLVRPLKGEPRLRVDFSPRLNYGQGPTWLFEAPGGLTAQGETGPVCLQTNLPAAYVTGSREFYLREPLFFAVSHGMPYHTNIHEVEEQLASTLEGWRNWAKTCALPAFGGEAVLRSALCLKLHIYEDTGAIIAATTTSIPEALGTERTWDYRYCWLRDAAFVVEALRRLSCLNEGERFLRFLAEVVESGPLQPLYAVDGGRNLPEHILEHLSGFQGTGPVRIGNAAAHQIQHDLMGEMVLCMETLLTDPRLANNQDQRHYLPLLKRLVREALKAFDKQDTSIWEFRTRMGHYTFSKAMCWAAMHRGARLATHFGQIALAREWEGAAQKAQQTIIERGFNKDLNMFTQMFEGQNADAANLLLPALGILPGMDPRFLGTLEAYENTLVQGGLMQRYQSLDDFGETTSTFTVCSFWWAEALALAGDLEKAIEVFNHVCSFANPLGLFSEDIDPETGNQLGNFPQAYTHVGLIHAACTINELLDLRDARIRTWTRV